MYTHLKTHTHFTVCRKKKRGRYIHENVAIRSRTNNQTADDGVVIMGGVGRGRVVSWSNLGDSDS